MPTVAVVTFGCRVNQADSLELERTLRLDGLPSAPVETADVIVINTCSVTASADQGARQTIRRLNRDNPSPALVVTGCYATRSTAEMAALPGVVSVVPNTAKDDLAEHVRAARGRAGGPTRRTPQPGEGPCGRTIEPGLGGRTAWTLRVQTGCDEPCAYCIIPLTRGRPLSRPLAEIVSEVTRVAADGFREVILTGVHLGSWGRDLTPPSSLATLLAALDRHPADVHFRVSSLEPMDCTSDVRARLVSSGRFAPHLHLPLQHGSETMLRAMRRPYTPDYYDALVTDIACRLPGASIGSDVLVGFPGETDADHAANVAFLARSPLTHLHVFPYSDRPGTVASRLAAKVGGAVVRERAGEIRAVGAALTSSFRRRMMGSRRPGLTIEDGTLVVTDNYLKVRIPPGRRRNERVFVEVTGTGDPLDGVVVTGLTSS